jgi:exonuclease III
VLTLSNYVWFGNNRIGTHIRAPKGSGGVGIFVHDRILERYEVQVIEKTSNGFIAVQFTYKFYQFIIVSCYLPPENSVWGRDSEFFFSSLLQFIYNVDVTDIIICGDLNSRIGNLKDTIDDIDELPRRSVLDNHVNQHGRSLIDFFTRVQVLCIER